MHLIRPTNAPGFTLQSILGPINPSTSRLLRWLDDRGRNRIDRRQIVGDQSPGIAFVS